MAVSPDIAPFTPRLAAAKVRRRPRLLAVGGGKGGVGKSVVTSSLGVALAARRRRCTLVDADFGAANLHTLLGVERSAFSLSDFLNREVAELDQVACRTRIPRLSLVSGAHALVDVANLAHSRKLKLTRHLARLDTDEVLIDLGAGTAFNVLDFFVAADRGLLVVEPEPTSIENSYAFLKAAFLRSLRPIAREPHVRAALEEVLGRRARHRLKSPQEIISGVADLDPNAARALRKCIDEFRPLLIVNGVCGDEERGLGQQIARACRNFLGIRVETLGVLPRDEAVVRAVRRRRPVVEISSSCPFWREIEVMAERLSTLDRPSRAATQPAPAPAASGAADLAMPGAYLRHLRERLGLSLEQAVQHTRIRLLEAIEEETFDQLPPEEPYLRGLVQSYARALGAPRPEAIAIKYLERYRYSQRWAERPPTRVAG